MDGIIKDFLKQHKAEHLFDDFLSLLKTNDALRWKIFMSVEHENHLEDVRIELEELGIKTSDEVVKQITTYYEDRLLDLEDWHFVLRDCIENYLED
jgi:hypothetical protein